IFSRYWSSDVCSSDLAFADDLVSRGLAERDKIFFVPNGVDPDEFKPGARDNEFRRAMGWGERFVVLYAGAHGRANALSQLVETRSEERREGKAGSLCI